MQPLSCDFLNLYFFL